MDFEVLFGQHGYLAIVLASFIRGDVAVALAGSAAQKGALSFLAVAATGATINFAWDQLYFHLGRAFGPRLLAGRPRLAARIDRFRGPLERFQIPLIVGMRFIYGFRAAGPIAFGMTRVPVWIFVALTALGAAIWGLAIAGAGYVLGHAVEGLLAGFATAQLWLLAGAVAVAAWWYMGRQHRAKPLARARSQALRRAAPTSPLR